MAFCCPNCPMRYTSKQSVNIHIKNAHDKFQFVCPFCHESYTLHVHWKHHILTGHPFQSRLLANATMVDTDGKHLSPEIPYFLTQSQAKNKFGFCKLKPFPKTPHSYQPLDSIFPDMNSPQINNNTSISDSPVIAKQKRYIFHHTSHASSEPIRSYIAESPHSNALIIERQSTPPSQEIIHNIPNAQINFKKSILAELPESIQLQLQSPSPVNQFLNELIMAHTIS